MTKSLNLTAPTSWNQLSQDQLSFLLKTIASVNDSCRGKHYNSQADFSTQVIANIAIKCLLHWNNIKVIANKDDLWSLKYNKNFYTLSTEQLTAAVVHLKWIANIPDYPVRLDVIDGAHAVSPDIEDDLCFDDYLACESCWQLWQSTQNDSLLQNMAAILYKKENISLQKFELLSIFYWWASLKAMLAIRYPNFLQPAPISSDNPQIDQLSIRKSIDSQIRALTKGDITKESAILNLPAIRAITELDALAKEFDDLNRKYPQK